MVSAASWPQHRQREAFPPGLRATAASQAAPQGPDVRCAFTCPCPGAGHRLERASRVCVLREAGVFLPLPQTFPVNWNSFVLPKLTRPEFTCGHFAFELDLIFEDIIFFTQKFLGKIGKHRKAKKKEKNPPQLLLACCRVPLKSYSCLHRGVREVWKHWQVDRHSMVRNIFNL